MQQNTDFSTFISTAPEQKSAVSLQLFHSKKLSISAVTDYDFIASNKFRLGTLPLTLRAYIAASHQRMIPLFWNPCKELSGCPSSYTAYGV